ncbi:MAG: hypothetical protein PHW07_03210 [Sulfurospirillaceae bacterium]|nr:hypothetical protein [Sulfurospirillaceae bacterium]
MLSCAYGAGAGVRERTFVGPQFEIVDLSVNKFSDGTLLNVNGYVKNSSFASVKGYVVVYFNNGGNVVLALEENVNGGAPFLHGSKGFFEVSTNIEGLPKINNITVEFISR